MSTTRLRPVSCVVALAFLSLCSCDQGPTIYDVTGSVSYRGQPVTDGHIIFTATDGSLPAAAGIIENGTYSIRSTAGKKTVRISATEETGRTIEGAMGVQYPERIDLIPPIYNTATSLVRTIDPEGDLVINFELE